MAASVLLRGMFFHGWLGCELPEILKRAASCLLSPLSKEPSHHRIRRVAQKQPAYRSSRRPKQGLISEMGPCRSLVLKPCPSTHIPDTRWKVPETQKDEERKPNRQECRGNSYLYSFVLSKSTQLWKWVAKFTVHYSTRNTGALDVYHRSSFPLSLPPLFPSNQFTSYEDLR